MDRTRAERRERWCDASCGKATIMALIVWLLALTMIGSGLKGAGSVPAEGCTGWLSVGIRAPVLLPSAAG